MSHQTVVCQCGKQLSTCRCISPNKAIVVSTDPCRHRVETDPLISRVAWALHCWTCPLCYLNGIEAMGVAGPGHVTQSELTQAAYLVGALGLKTQPEDSKS